MIGLLLLVTPFYDLQVPVFDEDVQRFRISAESVAIYVDFAQRHVDWLKANRIMTDPDNRNWLDEAEARYRAWYLLWVVKLAWDRHEQDEDGLLTHLAELKEIIGWENYQRGTMPDNVPTHRFLERIRP